MRLHGYAAMALGLTGCVDLSSSDSSSTSSYAGVAATAELSPVEGREVVQATITDVTVRAADGSTLASAIAYEPVGSADEVVAIRVTDGYVGAPLIAVTTTLGGHRESTTHVALYRFDPARRALDIAFSGPTVEVDGDDRAEGSLSMLPGALLYRAPHAELGRLYSYDASTRQYVAPPASDVSPSPAALRATRVSSSTFTGFVR